MSRSIHTTRRQLAKARRFQYADDARKREVVQKLRRELYQKHWTKHQMRQERVQMRQPDTRAVITDGTPVAVSAISIETESGGDTRYIHHAVSPEDLRALLAVLPPGMADGLTRIVLTLGKPDMECWVNSDQGKPDPLTGRRGWEVIDGVYSGVLLGAYRAETAGIWLYAYVYDADKPGLPLPLPLCEVYLRLQALITFAHELAHHFDDTQRVARGRWLALDKKLFEGYAEAREQAWGQEYVVPLLRGRYPTQVRALEEWIAHHGGLRVPLEWLVEGPRVNRDTNSLGPRFAISRAFEGWLSDLAEEPKDLFTSRYALAQNLHWGDCYDLCLKLLDALLSEWTPTCKLLTFKADTLVHLERWDEAEACAREALKMDDTALDAWAQLGWVAVGRHDWPATLEVVEKRLSLIDAEADAFEWRETKFHQAIAYCGLNDFARMEECLSACVSRDIYLKSRRKAVYHWAGVPLAGEILQP